MCRGFFLCQLKRSFLGGMTLLWAKREERFGGQLLCVSFGWFGREEIGIAFENKEFLIRKLKYSFVNNFWLWAKLRIDEGPNFLINFFDWLDSS